LLHWAQAFAGKIFMWGFAAAIIAFAITLQIKTFYIVLGVSLVGYTLYWISRRRSTDRKPPVTP
jgi:hypothetical protein